MFHESLYIAETEEFRNEWLWGEAFEVVKVFANTKEDDRSFSGCNAERR